MYRFDRDRAISGDCCILQSFRVPDIRIWNPPTENFNHLWIQQKWTPKRQGHGSL